MVSTSGARDRMYRVHECTGQLQPLAAGLSTFTGSRNSSCLAISFHVSKNACRIRMGRGKVRPVAAV